MKLIFIKSVTFAVCFCFQTEGRTVTGSSPHSDLPHQPSWTLGTSPTDLTRDSRVFLPRRWFTKTCLEVSTQPNQNSAQLANILEILNGNTNTIQTLNAKLDTIIAQLEGTSDGGSGDGGGGTTRTCRDGYTLNNDQCFQLFDDKFTYPLAMTTCADEGGTLATMTADNAAFLYGLVDMSPNGQAYIGLTRFGSAWEWEDGTAYPGEFTDWPGDEPNIRGVQCTVAADTGIWVPTRCRTLQCFICQIEPEEAEGWRLKVEAEGWR